MISILQVTTQITITMLFKTIWDFSWTIEYELPFFAPTAPWLGRLLHLSSFKHTTDMNWCFFCLPLQKDDPASLHFKNLTRYLFKDLGVGSSMLRDEQHIAVVVIGTSSPHRNPTTTPKVLWKCLCLCVPTKMLKLFCYSKSIMLKFDFFWQGQT